MCEQWTDERLDDLNRKVDVGFDRIDKRFDSVDRRFDSIEAGVGSRFDRIESRLDFMQRTMGGDRADRRDARWLRRDYRVDRDAALRPVAEPDGIQRPAGR
jgi:tetrahydromethanopterin S-methyltransferase subunit G